MKFQLVSDRERKIHLNMDVINTYTSKWVPGTPVYVEVVRRVPRKSDPMRKWYWSSVLPPFMQELGYDPDEDELFHKQLKITFFRIKPDKRGIYRNKDIPSVFGNESEMEMDTKQKFLDWVLRKAAIEGAYIPNPGE